MMQKDTNLTLYKLTDLAHLKVHGRTTGNLAPLTLFWTGSAIELNARGSELWIEVEADYDIYEQWISIFINGTPVSRQMVTAGRHWICLFRGMNPTAIKNIRVIKDVQAMSGDPASVMHIHAVQFDGEFVPVEERPYKLEFIGDSITSGEGTLGGKKEEDWIPMWFSAVHNYTAMTAEALNAEYRVISQSGWGVLSGWDNNPHSNIPGIYDQVCGLLFGETNQALGALQQNDFESWQPDVVIVNLGTNDDGAFHSPEWKDPVTGKTHKQKLHEDGIYDEEDLKSFEEAVSNFLIKLRKYNRHAHIIWAYGMLGIPMLPAIFRAVDDYVTKSGDRKVSVFQLPNMTEETVGARTHPGALAHKKAAEELAGYISSKLETEA